MAERLLYVIEGQGADYLVRITGDCPLVDPGLVDGVVSSARQGHPDLCDYASNVFPVRSYPDGLDVEVLSRACLVRLAKEPVENLTTTIWNRPREFATTGIMHTADLSKLGWTLDTSLDLDFIQWVYRRLPVGFSWLDVLWLARCTATEYRWRFPV